eukprot:jgi/Ulvmu1/8916/UM005_0007.1
MLSSLTTETCNTATRFRCWLARPCQHQPRIPRDVHAHISRRSQIVSLATVPACVIGEQAISAEYDRYAATYDALDDGSPAALLGLPDLRRRLLSRASGRVLETAAGTGINLNFYEMSTLEHITMIDLSEGMLSRAETKAASLQLDHRIGFIPGDVQDLPFPTSTFDTVTDTFSFCVFSDPQAAMDEMARVLKPGGQLLLLEHSRSPNAALGWYQDVTENPVKRMGKGCSWNQRMERMVKDSGLLLQDVQYDLLGTVVSISASKPL